MIVNGVGRSVVKEGKSERYAWRTLSILFERELSFVEWLYLFTIMCNSLLVGPSWGTHFSLGLLPWLVFTFGCAERRRWIKKN